MERELATGLIILILAIAAIPAALFISTQKTDITPIIDWAIPQIPGEGILVKQETINRSEYPRVKKLVLNLRGTNGATYISEGYGYIARFEAYKGRGIIPFNLDSYKADISKSYNETTRTLSIYIDASNVILKIYIDPTLASEISINQANGALELSLDSLVNTDLRIEGLNTVIRLDLGYTRVDDVSWNIDITNGIAKVNITTPTEIDMNIEGSVLNGLAELNLYGTINKYYTNEQVRLYASTDRSLTFRVQNGNIVINLSTG